MKDWLLNDHGENFRKGVVAFGAKIDAAYCAFQDPRDPLGAKAPVVCLVFGLQYDRSSGMHGYKPLDEFMGPRWADCPEKVLKKLTPLNTEGEGESAKYAQAWRDKCQAKIDKRKTARQVKTGTAIKFKNPVRFSNGSSYDTFERNTGDSFFVVLESGNGPLVTFRGWRTRDFKILGTVTS